MDEDRLLSFLAEHITKLPKKGTKIIFLVGGPGGGKGVLVNMLAKMLPHSGVLSTDDYLLGDQTYRKELERCGRDPYEKYDFIFLRAQVEAICRLQAGQSIGVPLFEAASGVAIGKNPDISPGAQKYTRRLEKLSYLIIEGDVQPLPRKQVDCLIYLDVPDEVRLANRIHRDLRIGRESSPDAVAESFAFRQSQFERYTLPHKRDADIVVSVQAKDLLEPNATRKFSYLYSVTNRQHR